MGSGLSFGSAESVMPYSEEGTVGFRGRIANIEIVLDFDGPDLAN